MGWLIREKRGPAWKHGWGDRAVASLSPPPASVLTIFLIVIVLLWMSFSVEYDRQVRRAVVGMNLMLLLLPVLLFILVSRVSIDGGRLVVPLLRAEQDVVRRAGSVPWGVVVLLVLVLVMLYYQPGFHSKWSPWRSY
ncbi:hypothetical protein MLD38_002132 [Melastoma candidum]|uniref:Uncharacterized protein n=1 Tax=Melastoma candidum TaxID=119954 RepID=A0ACB9SKE6_9MYRT|nr:hypothetical protein MLD38_002132 [Melastoma candidum]